MVTEKGEVISKDVIPAEVGLPSPTNANRWWKAQVKYRNFAGVSDALDLMAATTLSVVPLLVLYFFAQRQIIARRDQNR